MTPIKQAKALVSRADSMIDDMDSDARVTAADIVDLLEDLRNHIYDFASQSMQGDAAAWLHIYENGKGVSFSKPDPTGSVRGIPLYTQPQSPAVDVSAFRPMLEQIQDSLEEAYRGAYPVCCGRPGLECCGSPKPEWSEADQKIMNLLGPVQTAVSAMLSASQQGGE